MSLAQRNVVEASTPETTPGPPRLPLHVGIIMDGNGRWAAARGLPRTRGHEQGAETVRAVVRAARARGLRALTLYAFSSENWERPPSEVLALMKLLASFVVGERDLLLREGIRVVVLGDRTRLPAFVRAPLAALESATAGGEAMSLGLALSYSSRAELTAAARALAAEVATGQRRPETISEAALAAHLGTRDLPPLDLVIRTSGERRLSNFLLWEAAYAELYFTPTLWPDFDAAAFDAALADFTRRQRRFGR